MSDDATFEEGAPQPLALKAFDAEGLQVISALVQDAVFPSTEMTWQREARRFALLLNRFRWEDKADADRAGRAYERVRSVLVFEDVGEAVTRGLDRRERDTVFSLLAARFEADDDGGGRVTLTLAGDGEVALSVEALEATLKDVTRPYAAPSGRAPGHGASA